MPKIIERDPNLAQEPAVGTDKSNDIDKFDSRRARLAADVQHASLNMEQKTGTVLETVGAEFREAGALHRERAAQGRWWLWLAIFGVLSIAAYGWSLYGTGKKPVTKSPSVPVAAGIVKSGELNIYLNQIGTVTPFNTVTVKSRIAGQITKIDFKEGDLVKAGQLLVNIDPSPYEAQLQQYEGQLARDQATLANARITLERYRLLYKNGVIASQDLDNQDALYRQAIGTVKNDEGMIAGVKINLDYCRIVSPIMGRMGLRQVDLGNYVQPTDNLVVITQLQPISVIFSVPEDDIPEVVKDMHAGQVPVTAWNRDFSKKIATGSLLTFDNEVDQNTGTVKLRAQFPNTDYALFPDEFVNASMLVKTVRNTMLVPTAAVQTGAQGSFVYVVQPNHTVTQRQVTLGPTQGDLTAVVKGVKPGDKVVTDGLDKLQPGTRVVVQIDSSSSSGAVLGAGAQTGG